MKLLPIALASLACLSVVSEARNDKSVSGDAASAGSPEAQRKRDAGGYSYVRPGVRYSSSHAGERIHARIVARGPNAEASRPFARYGPPRHQSVRIFVEDSASGGQANTVRNTQQRAPSASRQQESAEASPIAAQNNLPFDSKSANYLPPRNQKLPGRTSSPYSFANDHQLAQLRASQSLHQQRQISDAAAFLAENSRAISQLYEAPAVDLNYEPANEETRDNTNNFNDHNLNFRPIDSFPSYASGFVDRDALGSIKSLEKDRLIKQLQHELEDSRHFRNNNNNNNNDLESQRNALSQDGRRNPQPDRSIDNFHPHLASTSAPTSGYAYQPPATPSTLPSSTIASTLATAPTNQAPQASGSHPTSQTGSGLQQPATSLQFPQFTAGFVPSLLPNYFPGYPLAPLGNVLTSGSTNLNNAQTSAPTHFGIPIPTFPTPVQKPASIIPQNTENPPHSVPLQPLNPISTNPIQPFPLVPAAVTPVHQLLNPTSTNLIGHPTYGVQSTNQIHVKPIKAVYPIYYYQNVYQLQKPGLATLPWNYAPSYSQQVRPDQAWK